MNNCITLYPIRLYTKGVVIINNFKTFTIEFLIHILITPIFHFPLFLGFFMSYANIGTTGASIIPVATCIAFQLFLHSIPSIIRYKIFKISKKSLLYSLISAISMPIVIFICFVNI